MSPLTRPVLDHIVILVPPSFLSSPPAWLTDSLTILPGGTHSDGLTSNKLIVFSDGSYLELIAFADGLDPARRASHRWGRKAEGEIVDWALTMLEDDTSSSEEKFRPVQERVNAAGTGFGYADPVPGGRTRPDGVELRWAISAPAVVETGTAARDLRITAGELPFWCLDRSPRAWRVLHADPGNTTHPSGAVGVASLTVSVRGEKEVRHLRRAYQAIADGEGRLAGEGMAVEQRWEVDVPLPVEGGQAKVVLKGWEEEEQGMETLTDDGVHIRLALLTKDRQGSIEGSIGERKFRVDLIPLANRLRE